MDFQNFKNGVEFMYVLPFTANKALFESTYFSKRFLHEKNYRKNVVNYLKKNFKNCEYSIKYKENGLIPMFYNKFDNCNNFSKLDCMEIGLDHQQGMLFRIHLKTQGI